MCQLKGARDIQKLLPQPISELRTEKALKQIRNHMEKLDTLIRQGLEISEIRG